MERLEHIKEMLLSSVEGQLGHLEQADTHELGEVIDMIKDIYQCEYYCSIAQAMDTAEDKMKYIDKHISKGEV